MGLSWLGFGLCLGMVVGAAITKHHVRRALDGQGLFLRTGDGAIAPPDRLFTWDGTIDYRVPVATLAATVLLAVALHVTGLI